VVTLETLTGEWVLEFRKRHRLGRDALMREGGWEGKSGARIMNIETKNAWKAGDKERFLAVVARLEPESLNGSAPTATPPTASAQPADSPPASSQDELSPPAADNMDAGPYWVSMLGEDDLDIDWDAAAAGVLVYVGDVEGVDHTYDDECTHAAPGPADQPAPTETPGAARMPAGWEHLYPPTDARHRHKFVDGTGQPVNACTNIQCSAARDDGVTVKPTPAQQLLSAEVGTELVALQRPSITLPQDGLYAASNSELNAWRTCRRQWWLLWFRQLALATESRTDARATGDRLHRALAAWYVADPAQRVDPRDALERVIVEDWTEIRDTALKAGMDEAWLATTAEEFATVNAVERLVIEGYVQWLEETGADAGYQVLGSEQALAAVVPVDNDGTQARLIAKLDARVRRESDNVRLFIDHKSTGSNLSVVKPTLKFNPQMKWYHVIEWVLSPAGERVDGALYNMLKKSKRTVRATGPFYDRVEIRHNEHELRAFFTQSIVFIREILQAKTALDAGVQPDLVVPPAPGEHCRWCDVRDICFMLDDGSRAEDAIAENFVTRDPLTRYNGIEVVSAAGTS
jgi:hypothetical protein